MLSLVCFAKLRFVIEYDDSQIGILLSIWNPQFRTSVFIDNRPGPAAKNPINFLFVTHNPRVTYLYRNLSTTGFILYNWKRMIVIFEHRKYMLLG
jgi:hypothetical protein